MFGVQFGKYSRRFSAIKRRYCESFKNEKNIFRDVTAPLLDVSISNIYCKIFLRPGMFSYVRARTFDMFLRFSL